MSRRIRRTVLLAVGCVSFLAGLGLARLNLSIPIVFLLICLALVFLTFRKQSLVSLLVITLCGVSFGIARGHSFLPNTTTYSELNMQKVEIVGIAETDAVYDERKQVSFDMSKLKILSPIEQDLVGKIKVGGFGENAIYKGDKVRVTGKLFQTRGSRQASIGFAELEVLDSNPNIVDDIRRSFAAGLSNMLPDPEAPLGLGLLIGQRSTLGSEATGWLSSVGLTHIIAVSGYNLTIIIRFVHRLFSKKSRYQTVLASALLITAFLLITGFSASIIRAALVSGISLIAWYYGRRVKPVLLITLVAAITAGWYPVYLWSDIGWYLSFLAFFGVLVLAPRITTRYWKSEPKAIGSAVVESFCAQLITLPLILYIFGETSPLALIANVLVVPLVPLVMLLTLVAGIFGMFLPTFLLFALPASLLLTYILNVAHALSNIPGARMKVEVSLPVTLFFYLVFIIFCIVLERNNLRNRGTITDVNMM